MTLDSSSAATIAAMAGLVTAVAVLITAVTGLITARRVERKVDLVHKTGEDNHKMLNQESTDRMNFQRALIRTIRAGGLDVPIDQSVPEQPPTAGSLALGGGDHGDQVPDHARAD